MNTFYIIGLILIACFVTVLLIVKFSPIFKNTIASAVADCDGMCDHCPQDTKIICRSIKSLDEIQNIKEEPK